MDGCEAGGVNAGHEHCATGDGLGERSGLPRGPAAAG